MRILLDECLPRRLGLELLGHSVTTVQKAGWSGLSNGKLLARIEHTYEAFITIDRKLPDQQNVSHVSFGLVLLRAPSNRLDDLRPLVPHILGALTTLKAGDALHIAANGVQP